MSRLAMQSLHRQEPAGLHDGTSQPTHSLCPEHEQHSHTLSRACAQRRDRRTFSYSSAGVRL